MSKAQTLTDPQIARSLAAIDGWSKTPIRDKLMLLLTFRAGLRSQEVALLDWEDVTDADRRLTHTLHVTSHAAKYGRERYIPIREDLLVALRLWNAESARCSGPMFLDRWKKRITPNAVQQKLARIYERAGLHGASSHSGRRTFATRAARSAGKVGCSLRDVQHLLGHADIATTETYVDIAPSHTALVGMI